MNGVSLAHYNSQPVSGFGTAPAADVQELSKALEAGYQVSSQTGGGALRVESLEGSLKVVSYTSHHIKMWKKIHKSPAYSTVEEYNQLTAYGSNANAFLREGELAPTQDSTYARRTAFVKYIGVTREVSHPMTVVHPAHGDVIALENQNGILWLLQQVENSLFHGDSSLAFSGESEQWDGLDALIDPTSYLDLEGDPMQEADIEEATNLLVEQFAYPTDLWLGTRNASDLVKTFYPRERVSLPAPENGRVGMNVSSVMTQAGVMELNPSVFLRELPSPPSAATSSNAPAQPASIAGVAAATGTGNFTKGAPSGTVYYGYAVTSCNRFGESAPRFIAANNVEMTQANAEALESIALTITNAASVGTFPPEYFRIYRTNALPTDTLTSDVADYSLVMQVPADSQANSGVTAASDVNFLLPFTSIAYMGEMTEQVLTFRQLLPLMRMDLAVTSPSYRWMILMYGTPILFANRKWLRIINVGRLE
jgi:hypothetical protein